MKAEGTGTGRKAAVAKKKTRSAPPSYVVRKGDTMEKIAARNNTSLSSLLKLNNMKLKDPLLAGKRLKLPSPAE